MKKAIVCLYGGPGTGKSTTAAALFSALKYLNKDVELVREYIKDWIWEGRSVLPQDQFYLLAKQARRERILLQHNDYIVTDSPLYVNAYYESVYEEPPYLGQMLIKKHTRFANQHGFEHLHVFLGRLKPYNPRGRFQNEEQARSIDDSLRDYLTGQGVDFHQIPADELAPQAILDLLGL